MSDILRASEERRRRALIDSAISVSHSRAELVGHLEGEAEVSDVAKSLEGKALLASKSPWITVLAGAVGFLIAYHTLHFGYWGTGLVTIVSALFGGYIVRVSTRAPITGIIRPGSV